MRLIINTYFNLSLLLLLHVVALPLPNPRSWKTYGIYKILEGYPPFPPPDIGPLNLPRNFFNDYPDLTSDQIAAIKEKNFEEHSYHVRSFFLSFFSSCFPSILNVRYRRVSLMGFLEVCIGEEWKSLPADDLYDICVFVLEK